MASDEQEKPLAPTAYRISVPEDRAMSMELKRLYSNRYYVKWCGCISALFLILVVVVLVLVFTVFRVKDPVIKMNSAKIEGLDRLNVSNIDPSTNLTVIADVSVKNPNVASFKYENATTRLFYDGVVVGEARTPGGRAKARRTVRLNLTIDVMLGKILDVPRLGADLRSGVLPVSSYTSISGKVKIVNVIKRNVVVRLNCTMSVNITSRGIQDQHCRRHVSL
ncbi:hypothetical protein RJ640_018975 [Escallonia rubra]|uniref:Late embryogenesis abundant protein LEA-2 subgroup domain-containing protein n=1 Tax=Escallonia rubra TaxID=112253 RepID=A0AA88QS09_9ASTE|nr:hypothetical protein RJ640_018975 [Escallonia rubra]